MAVVRRCRSCGQRFDAGNNPVGPPLGGPCAPPRHVGPYDPIEKHQGCQKLLPLYRMWLNVYNFSFCVVFSDSYAVPFSFAHIGKLYEPSVSPSSVKSEDIKNNQLDESYYSPCASPFALVAHFLAFMALPDIQDNPQLVQHIEWTYADLLSAMSGSEPLGYCSQKHLKEEGITALLSVNLSKCFRKYSKVLYPGQEYEQYDDRVLIMHQGLLNTKAGRGDMDISLFFRFLETDDQFVHRGLKALFPLLFIEFTKSQTKSIDEKLPEAALYANHLLRLMQFQTRNTWIPLLGVIMSENEFLLRMYSPSLVDDNWKIAEMDVMRWPVSSKGFERLLFIMVNWTYHCATFLNTPSTTYLDRQLFLQKHSNTVTLGNRMYKCFDYRKLSGRSFIHMANRRAPDLYSRSGLTGLAMDVDWTSSSDPEDSLQIISYDLVEGVHFPTYIAHFVQLLRKVQILHGHGVVHGDLHLNNVLFSRPNVTPVVSTIIDFDYSGLVAAKRYPPRYNVTIEHGFRHAGAMPGEFLRMEHDVAAVRWMCEQYRPKSGVLSEMWRECIAKLGDGLMDVIGRLLPSENEELEPIALNRVVAPGYIGTGSPDAKRTHY